MSIFTEHPKSNGMTYWSHLWHSLYVAVQFMVAMLGMTVHAFLPFLFKDKPLSMGYSAYSSVIMEKKTINLQRLMLQNIALKRALELAAEDMCPEEAAKVLEEAMKYDFD